MQRFTSKTHIYEKFDLIGIQRRVVASFPDRMLLRNHPAFNYKEKSRGYPFLFIIFQNTVNQTHP